MKSNHFYPKNIGIELVRGCNFQCRMCPVGAEADFQSAPLQFMDLSLLEKIAGEIDLWPSIEKIWFFHFGEPLIHPDYRKCLEILHASPIARSAEVIQYTNASLLREEKAEAILEIPIIKKMVFSFDGFGDKVSFERLRGPHFEQVIENIRSFSEIAKKRRPDLSLSTCTIFPRAGEVENLEIPDPMVARKQLNDLFGPLGIQVEIRDMHAYSGNSPLRIKGRKAAHVFGGCRFVEQDSLYLTVTGRAQPCCAVYNEDFCIGRFPNQNFEELLNSPEMNKLRHLLRLDLRGQLDFCRKCSLSIGGLFGKEELQKIWQKREKEGVIQDLGERRHLLGSLLPTGADIVKLDLGCGKAKSGGFIGIDRFNLKGVDIVADLNDPLPFADNSVHFLLASHALEHVQDLIAAMQEIYRVCKHGAQVCIVAPYYNQGLNLANPYHKQTFNEHTPRFWTNANTTFIPTSEFEHPHAISWGLAQSDHSDPEIDFRCLRMEFFYFPQYRNLPLAEQREMRRKYLDVCDQIMYHLLVIKKPTGESEVEEIANKIEYYEPPYVTVRKLQEQQETIVREVHLLQAKLEKK
jgi:SAM-dependent methyltransferase/pyruvate-formate lyase-activating enzyme